MKQLVIVQPYVPTYRVPFFEGLVNKLGEIGIECRVLAGQPTGTQRHRNDAAAADWIVEIPYREISLWGRSLKFGGAGRHVHGADAVIVGHIGTSWDTNKAVLNGAMGGTPVGLWGHIKSYVSHANPLGATVERWQLSNEPDVVHLHNLHGYYLNMPLLFSALQLSGARVIWTLHDCWAFTGHCTHFAFAGCDKWRTHCGNYPQKCAYPASYGLDSSKRNYDDKHRLTASMTNLTLVTPSEWLAELVGQSFLKEHPVEIIKNGIDQTAFQPTATDFKATHGIEDKFVVLGVASRWTERKGALDFIKLSRRLGPDYVIVLVGVDPALARRPPSTFITFARTESQVELVSIYSVADVFFNPTYEDNYPTTNLEAICCGTPVVTYETGGSPESVTGDRGAVVPQGDLDRAAMVIAEFCGQRHRTPSSQPEFDNRLMCDRYLALYDRAES